MEIQTVVLAYVLSSLIICIALTRGNFGNYTKLSVNKQINIIGRNIATSFAWPIICACVIPIVLIWLLAGGYKLKE